MESLMHVEPSCLIYYKRKQTGGQLTSEEGKAIKSSKEKGEEKVHMAYEKIDYVLDHMVFKNSFDI